MMDNTNFQVIPIDPDKRYAIRLTEQISLEHLLQLKIMLNEWQKSDDQFLIIGPGVELVKLEDDRNQR